VTGIERRSAQRVEAAPPRRPLTPRGTLHLVYEPPSAVRLRDLRESLAGLLHEHGFDVMDVAVRAFRASHGLCIIGRPG
jgi:hypothetical protein